MIVSKLAAPAIGIAIGLAGITIAEKALPVTMWMTADKVSYEGRTYTADVRGYKVRSCVVVPGTSVGWYKSGGTWHETPIIFPDDETPDSSKPKSYSLVSFGLFQWGNLPNDATKVRMTVVHSCNGHLEITTVGPFDINRSYT